MTTPEDLLTVGKLIEALKALPQDAPVMTRCDHANAPEFLIAPTVLHLVTQEEAETDACCCEGMEGIAVAIFRNGRP
jgi:hypothetical protein